MKNRKFLSFALLGLSLAALSGCGKKSDAFYVAYFDGGYGANWLETFVKEYLAEQKGTTPDKIVSGKDYRLVADADITYTAGNYVKSKRDCPDLLITNNLEAKLVSDGYIAGLSSLYEEEITKMDGSKVKIKNYVDSSCAERYHYEKQLGREASMDYWAIPWSSTPCSIAYNETLLQKITHYDANGTVSGLKDGDKWALPPETLNDVFVYFKDIDNYNATAVKKVDKFGWAGKDGTQWFEFMTMTWFAELHGTSSDKLNAGKYASYGTFDNFWELPAKESTAEIFKWPGIQDALDAVKSLVTKDDGSQYGKYINSPTNADAMSIKDLQTKFADGDIALCLTGDWFEHEYINSLQHSGQVIKTMSVPSLEGAVTRKSDNKTAKLTYLTTDNVMFVPSNAPHKDMAFGLLKYMTEEKQCIRFTQETGGIRPFNYDARNFETAINPSFKYSVWQKSVFDLYYDADDRISKFPRSLFASDEMLSPVYIYEGDAIRTLTYGVDYVKVIDKLRKYTGADIMINGFDNNVENAAYSVAKKSFAEYETRYAE